MGETKKHLRSRSEILACLFRKPKQIDAGLRRRSNIVSSAMRVSWHIGTTSGPSTAQTAGETGSRAGVNITEHQQPNLRSSTDTQGQCRLQDRILCAETKNMLGHSYIPSEQIRNIITRACVDEELSKWRFKPRKYLFALRGIGLRIESSTAQATRLVPSSQCHERQRRKDEKTYRVVFAILLYPDRATEIWSFVEEGICDDDLPLSKVVPPLSRRHRDLRRRNDPNIYGIDDLWQESTFF